MKTRVIDVKSTGEGTDEALFQAELVAQAYHLEHKDAIHMRLLSEEMMGMLRSVTGKMDAQFWVEESDGRFELHLATSTNMYYQKKTELLSLASNGRNAASTGFMGKLRSIIETAVMPEDEDSPDIISMGFMSMGTPGSYWLGASADDWTLNNYRTHVANNKEESGEASDELEKSIVAKLADDVSISVRGDDVEMIIYKKF